ncbi:hypothetical protein MC885_002002 [Smutsia gigantea]|nr:hypothetical protein MC885_002002 [Smutsia gigantea]
MSTATGPEAAPKPSAKSIYEQRKRYSTVVMADVSQYLVNHLVTFCLGEEDGVHTVEDASRKLAVMDSQGRVWAQEMLLRVSPDHVTLLDPASKEELESYPLGAIVRCDAVVPPGRSRSLLLLVCQEPERTQPDVHFFQGLRLGAELIREDIQGALHNYRSGRGELRAAALRATQEELLRRPSPTAETPPLQRRPSIRAVISTSAPAAGRGRPQAEPISEAEEARRPGLVRSSTGADPASPDLGPRGPDLTGLQAERDVDILNHVFDDVESFVSRLQKSAEAARVLEHRERGRRNRRRAAGGEGAPERILGSHGHSPICALSLAPPLALPAAIPRGAYLSLSDPARPIPAPSPRSPPPPTEGLLTLRAKPPSEDEYIDVLQKIKYAFSLLARLRRNIANPSSPELLHFLFGPLQMIVDTSGGPQFASSVRRPHLTSEAVALLRDNVTPRENTLWTSLGDWWIRPGLELPPEEGPPYSPEFYSGWEPPATDAQGRAWEDPIEKQLQHERRRRQVRLKLPGEQQAPRGDTAGRDLEVRPRLTGCSNLLQQSAPQVAVNGRQGQEPEAEPQPELEGKWVLCNYDFQARNSSELSVKQQDVLEVLDDRRKWWKVRDQIGQEGYIPFNILTPHPGPRRSGSQSPAQSLENSTPPPRPAPAPAPAPALAQPHWDSCSSLSSLDPSQIEKFSQMLSVNEELQARLAQGRSGPSRATPGPRAPEPQLSPRSDASEVRAWLQAKGFSSGTVDALGKLTGAQLFSLQKEELRAVSPEQGARVYSQVTVQRALLEGREKVSELEAVMEKQKKKVEDEMETEVI